MCIRDRYIGDPDVEVSGEQSYEFGYTLDIGDDGISVFDEFYFNLIAPTWAAPIDHFSFTIHMPKEFDVSKVCLLYTYRIITKEKQVEVVVLDMPLLDTRQGRDLTGTLIADIVLQLLSYVAQTERENIRQRQAEGIAAAKLRGVKFGRPPKPVPPDFYTLRTQWLAGEITSRKAAAQIGVAQDTFLRWVRLKPELRKSPEEILIENNDGNIEHCGDTQPHQRCV